MSNMKDEWFEDYYTEVDHIFDSIQRGLNGLGPKTDRTNRSTSNNKPSSRLWDYSEASGDDEYWARDEVDIIKEHKDMTKEDYFRFDLYNVQDELADILLSKHEDYGKNNIMGAPGGALNGIRVRMHDKVARLNNLLDKNKEPNHESIRDTLIDLANYATIAIMVIDDTWDK
jgi:hypothetical protein